MTRTRACQPGVSLCLAALRARQLRCLAEHPAGYLAELRAELPVIGLGQGTDGHELRFAVNYLAPVLLTRLAIRN